MVYLRWRISLLGIYLQLLGKGPGKLILCHTGIGTIRPHVICPHGLREVPKNTTLGNSGCLVRQISWTMQNFKLNPTTNYASRPEREAGFLGCMQ